MKKKRRVRRRHFVLAFAAVSLFPSAVSRGRDHRRAEHPASRLWDDRPAFSPYRQASGQAGLELNLFGYQADLLTSPAPAAFFGEGRSFGQSRLAGPASMGGKSGLKVSPSLSDAGSIHGNGS